MWKFFMRHLHCVSSPQILPAQSLIFIRQYCVLSRTILHITKQRILRSLYFQLLDTCRIGFHWIRSPDVNPKARFRVAIR